MPDLAVIGAGPAGAAAAILLARAGCRVTLIEQHPFPHHKVCGECISSLGLDVLDRLGLIGSLREVGAVALGRAILHPPAAESASVVLPRPMWGLSRFILDDLLLSAAREAGVVILQPARCETIEPGRAPSVRVRDLKTNRTQVLGVGRVLLADGKAGLLGRRPESTGDFGLKAHFDGLAGPRDAVELFGLEGCYAGLAPIEGGRWNLACSVPAARMARYRGRLDGLFDDLLRENRRLAERFTGARRVGEWLTSPLPRFAVQGEWPANVIPVGNAAAALEPIGGEGMGLALASAEAAADAILENRSSGWLRAEYRKLWRIRRAACRAAALLLSSPMLADFVIPRISDPAITAVGLRLIGKE